LSPLVSSCARRLVALQWLAGSKPVRSCSRAWWSKVLWVACKVEHYPSRFLQVQKVACCPSPPAPVLNVTLSSAGGGKVWGRGVFDTQTWCCVCDTWCTSVRGLQCAGQGGEQQQRLRLRCQGPTPLFFLLLRPSPHCPPLPVHGSVGDFMAERAMVIRCWHAPLSLSTVAIKLRAEQLGHSCWRGSALLRTEPADF